MGRKSDETKDGAAATGNIAGSGKRLINSTEHSNTRPPLWLLAAAPSSDAAARSRKEGELLTRAREQKASMGAGIC